MIFGQQRQTSHSVMARLSWLTLHDNLTLEVSGLYGFTLEDWMLRPAVTWSISDALRLRAGAELMGGPDDTMYGMVDETLSAGFVELRASY